MKVYNLTGYAILLLHLSAAALLAPPSLGPWWGLLIGFSYLVFSWFLCGVYLSDVIHMGITHRALDYKEWFIKAVTLLNNTIGIYVGPISWVNKHRHHHAFSDHDGDPNKLSTDGFWQTMYLCVFPRPCKNDFATDDILKSWQFRLVESSTFTVFSVFISYGFLWIVVRDWKFALSLWFTMRLFALWANMIQNYWTHDRRFGTRRYDDPDDNAMNIGDWLPVTATFSACLQNNHHHNSKFLRLSHAPSEYDFGFMTVRWMRALGLVKASATGIELPKDVALAEVGL